MLENFCYVFPVYRVAIWVNIPQYPLKSFRIYIFWISFVWTKTDDPVPSTFSYNELLTNEQFFFAGRMIQVIMIFYSLAFLILNLVLFFGSIKMNWFCAVPWLVCELVGCLSKFGALVYHLGCEPRHMSGFFIVGSVLYICKLRKKIF